MNRAVEIIFGAPGCGKTRKLMDILETELKEVEPRRIAYVSFTKKGSEEGLKRAREKFKFPVKEFRYFRTIHSICFRELCIKPGDMIAKKDYRELSKAVGMSFTGFYTEDLHNTDDRYLHMNLMKLNNPHMFHKMLATMDLNLQQLNYVEKNYTKFKKHIKKIDYSDLLLRALKANVQLDVDVAIIDEAQDLTTLQWKVCGALFNKAKRVYIAGDDDQAIFEWSGADVDYFLNVKGNRTILDKSWRLKKNLLDFSKQISSMISHRVEKDFSPVEDGGEIHYYNNVSEVKFNPDETYYCLGRNNCHLKRYTEELQKQAMYYTLKTKASISPSMVKAINNFESYKNGTLEINKVISVRQYLKKDIKTHVSNLQWYDALSLTPDESFYYRKLIENKTVLKDSKIMVNTIHGVKGGEADNVILLMDVTRTIHKNLDNLTDSELRCLYVACTRAKNKLHIIHSESKHSYSDTFKMLNILGDKK